MRIKIKYIRTSSREQQPELQLRDLEKICIDDATIYKEQRSAWQENVKRPVFAKVLELIEKDKVSDVYFWDLDRCYRSRLRLKDFFLLCKQHDCKIHSYNQRWLETIHTITPPFNDMVLELLTSVFGWIGEEESTKKSLRVKMAVVKNKHGQTYSYKGAKWGRKGFSRIVKEKVWALHKEGKSIREIAEIVIVYNKHGNERFISKSAVHKIIGQFSQ